MQDLTLYYELVEDVISSFGINPVACRGDKAGMWKMFKGSAEVWIDVWYVDVQERAYFQVMSPVIPVPAENQLNFYRELLEINDILFGVAFNIHKGYAYIKAIREVDGLDFTEISSTINRVGNYCDDYDDHLKTKYGEPLIPSAPPRD